MAIILIRMTLIWKCRLKYEFIIKATKVRINKMEATRMSQIFISTHGGVL